VRAGLDYIWGTWRSATLAELSKTWPARHAAGSLGHSRGWWQPTLAELRFARRNARSIDRRRRTRDSENATLKSKSYAVLNGLIGERNRSQWVSQPVCRLAPLSQERPFNALSGGGGRGMGSV